MKRGMMRLLLVWGLLILLGGTNLPRAICPSSGLGARSS
jgi:hypothetical protein